MYKSGSREYDWHTAIPFSIVVFCGERVHVFCFLPYDCIFLPAILILIYINQDKNKCRVIIGHKTSIHK
jgi:hypothetical protein